ncbi:MAG: hypothetical protein ACOX37_00565 [Bacillota bacterium]
MAITIGYFCIKTFVPAAAFVPRLLSREPGIGTRRVAHVKREEPLVLAQGEEKKLFYLRSGNDYLRAGGGMFSLPEKSPFGCELKRSGSVEEGQGPLFLFVKSYKNFAKI